VAKSLEKEIREPKSKGRAKTSKEDAPVKPEKIKPYHIVKKGETLASISDKYGVDIASLKSANRLKNNRIHAKMKLKIVAKGEG
jgi:membrane-bound lytic murein transglycosylase D